MKRQLCWIGLLTGFGALVLLAPELFGWPALNGVGGLVIRIFLGYCAIILIAQVFAALVALRALVIESRQPRTISQGLLLRTEQPTTAPED